MRTYLPCSWFGTELGHCNLHLGRQLLPHQHQHPSRHPRAQAGRASLRAWESMHVYGKRCSREHLVCSPARSPGAPEILTEMETLPAPLMG